MKKIENEVIIVGADHYNALGVIRSLGKCGINPIFLLVSNEKICFSSKSKYIKECIKISDNSLILPTLYDIKKKYNKKPILIPTGDPIEKLFDENYSELSEYYYLPNINEKNGEIIKLMDKTNQEKLCKKFKIKTAKSYILNINNFKYSEVYPQKVILKPYISADGKKSDIIIANGKNEIQKSMTELKKLGYDKILMQEFINYDMEYAMMGMSYKGNVIIPGINSNDYIYPSERGNTSFATMFPVDDFMFDISNIIDMISSMNYTGLFEVETFKVGNELYFNEMNFRNSANLYGYHGDDINYILLYVLLVLGIDISKEKKYVTKKYHFCIEQHHLKNVKEGKLNIFKCLYHILISTKLIFCITDLKPWIYKIVHAIDKKLFKGE